jgi:predicted NodU family carbamoyl transferase
MVQEDMNEPYWKLIKLFEERTRTPVLLNTSYNLSGDPIVSSPVDAIQAFYASGLNVLVIGIS